ncbi:hypothetical protein [Botryobacter ruber]|uniref:hypothetical protein n=1 Tax=Botryobacter ruber TaxID=2171629 RepID=UPI000E0AA3B8|nr:hypothetical protein [Botryobacter ruber]
MKRLLYLTYIGLLLPFAFACQEENIEPNGQIIETFSDTLEVKTLPCTEYSFFHKDFGNVAFGNARGDVLFVGFSTTFPQQARTPLLFTYHQVEAVDNASFSEYGPTIKIQLKPGTTCNQVEQMIQKLEKHHAVQFALPAVNDPNGFYSWLGLTNEFLVFFFGDENLPQFEALVRSTNTKILAQENFDGLYFCKLSADKHSQGNVLAMCTLFNQQDYIFEAVPNYILQFPPFGPFAAQATTTTAEEVKKKGLSALKNPNK